MYNFKMRKTFIGLTSVTILQFCSFVSAFSGHLMICGHSKYGFEEYFTRAANYLGYQVNSSSFCEESLGETPSQREREMRMDSKCTLNNTLKFKPIFNVIVNFDVIDREDYYSIKKLNDYDENMIAEYYGTINDTLHPCADSPNQKDMYERCRDPGFNKYTKLFIGSFKKHQALYNVFSAITNNLLEKWDVDNFKKEMVVCRDNLNSCPSYHKEGFLISCKRCDTRYYCNQNTIAILAPSPLNFEICDENVPVVFYDTLYMETNNVGTVYGEQYISNFDISTTTMHWKALASSVRRYILKKYQWQRVAIVSDDSVLSHSLTNEQETYFKQEKALFTIIRDCTEERDFKEALTFLNKFESRVIIVNVAKYNLNKFIEGAKALDMTDANIIWVFPGHQENDIKVFKFKVIVYLKYDLDKVIELVVDKYQGSFGIEKIFKKKIGAYRPSESCQEFDTCSITTRSIPYNLPFMGLGNCALRTSDYFHFCADWIVLYMILVIIVFLLLVFAVLLFFNHIQMNTLAYKPLNKPPSLWRQLLKRHRPPPRQGFPMRRRYQNVI